MIETIFLESAIKRVTGYKELGDKTFAQLTDADFHFQYNEESNSIAVIIQHLHGNMMSRWTDLLTSDGEKEWRHRDAEFEIKAQSKEALVALWEEGWACFLDALKALTPEDLLKTIHIRNESLTVIDGINRQLMHYPSHVGQIMYIGKMIRGNDWKSLSIPKGQSQQFNQSMKKP
jgi:hypothetical protein